MFLLNPGRYIVADPEVVLDAATYKKLWESEIRLGAHTLNTPDGTIIALAAGKTGDFATDLGVPITTASGHIAFLTCSAIQKLLPASVIRLALKKPTMLFFDAGSNIVLDGKLTIYCQGRFTPVHSPRKYF